MHYLSIFLIATIGLSGCATKFSYVEPAENEATATVTLHKAYIPKTGLAQGTSAMYFFKSNEECPRSVVAANFSMLTGSSKVRRVPANKPLYISSSITDVVYGNQYTCGLSYSFVPSLNGSYSVSNKGTGRACRLEVIDNKTGDSIQSLDEKSVTSENPNCDKE